MQGTVYLQTDADSVLGARCIGLLARHFNDPQVGAVCGRIEAQDREMTPWGRFLRTFQLADYTVGVLKRAFEQVLGGRRGSMGILPGCVLGARRDGLPDGVPGRTKAEDFLASLLIRRNLRGCEIRQEVGAVVYTEVPYTLRSALNQQIRWLIGPLQVVVLEWRMMLHIPRYGPLAWAVLPMTVISWLSAAFLVPLTYVTAVYLAFHGHVVLMMVYYCFFIVIRMAQLWTAMHITGEWSWARFFTCLYYRPLNDSLQVYVAWYGLWAFATGEIPGWTKPPRIGQATIREEVPA
jgi:cellulose synthase/poly-beta-1,6-N-acetylglucosamine synthase-like glycosyltransferase